MIGSTSAEVPLALGLIVPAERLVVATGRTPNTGTLALERGGVSVDPEFIASTIDERVIGVHVIGESAPEIIGEAAMAMHFRATLADFVELIRVYPTMSEALKIGAQAFSRDVTKLSCCAE